AGGVPVEGAGRLAQRVDLHLALQLRLQERLRARPAARRQAHAAHPRADAPLIYGNRPDANSRSRRAWRAASSAIAAAVSASRARRSASMSSRLVVAPA